MTKLDKLRSLAREHGGTAVDNEQDAWIFPTITAAELMHEAALDAGLVDNLDVWRSMDEVTCIEATKDEEL